MLNRRLFLDWGRSYYSLIYVADLARGLVAIDASEAARPLARERRPRWQ